MGLIQARLPHLTAGPRVRRSGGGKLAVRGHRVNRLREHLRELLGHILDHNDEHEKAARAYQRAIALTPNDNRSYKIALANCLWIHGVEAARTLLTSVKPRKSDPVWMQPPAGSHLSVVHGLPSSQLTPLGA